MRKIFWLIIVACTVRIVLIFIMNDSLKLGGDEMRNYQIALNHVNGFGYSLLQNGEYIPTAFHSSFAVLLYEALILLHVSKDFVTLLIWILSLLLYAVSIQYFYRLTELFLTPHRFTATVTYCFYPSVIYFIGSISLYENIVLPLLVLNFSFLLTDTHKKFIIVSSVLSCLVRPNILPVYVLLFLVHAFHKKKLHVPVYAFLLFVLLNIPVLIKNKNTFGSYFLSTQGGFEFLQGHSPVARGSWTAIWAREESPLYQYAHANIPGIDTMNEFRESQARKNLAWKWIKENPLGELKLAVRKVLIYFAPFNLKDLWGCDIFNPVNFLVHLFFLLWLLTAARSYPNLMLLAPAAASIITSLIFFVGYRWRFYAEPFMIIAAFSFLKRFSR
ncbi:MAG TPA: hypothetical protein VI757_09200 [Bacteroidia bacterium]|nr:hypothetical protein [Bacteroidia bacterium]